MAPKSSRAASPSPKGKSSEKPETSSSETGKTTKLSAKAFFSKLDLAGFYAVLNSLFIAVCAGAGIWLLSYLDKHPMPFLSKKGYYNLGLEDIKFYCPPHGAIALILFSAKNFSNLSSMAFGMILGTVAAVAAVEYGGPLLGGDPMLTRAVACSGAVALQLITGYVFAPAAALAVLFVDNKAMQTGIGKFFVFMPGLSGFVVLLILAYIKVALSSLLEGKKKVKTA